MSVQTDILYEYSLYKRYRKQVKNMNFKLVSDSSSNVYALNGVNYTTVPMKIIAGDKEFVDTAALDVKEMVNYLKSYKGKSGSSCANAQEWLDAFEGVDGAFGVTISKALSGSYNAACQAAEDFKEQNPDKKVYIFDSLAAGPQQAMLCDKIAELMAAGKDFDTIVAEARDYHNHTHILFCLESMTNLARNGRVNPTVAKIANAIGIRVCGDVKAGEIIPVHKPRGEKKAMTVLVDMLGERGFKDGNLIRVAHCLGEKNAQTFKAAVLAKYPNTRFIIEPTTGLCSFYAEAGGLMIGFEGGYNTNNNNNEH